MTNNNEKKCPYEDKCWYKIHGLPCSIEQSSPLPREEGNRNKTLIHGENCTCSKGTCPTPTKEGKESEKYFSKECADHYHIPEECEDKKCQYNCHRDYSSPKEEALFEGKGIVKTFFTPTESEMDERFSYARDVMSVTNKILEPLNFPIGKRQLENDRVDSLLKELVHLQIQKAKQETLDMIDSVEGLGKGYDFYAKKLGLKTNK